MIKRSLIAIVILIVAIAFSCQKAEQLPCYECTTTRISNLIAGRADTIIVFPGYPDTTTTVIIRCNMSEDDIRRYEHSGFGQLSHMYPPSVTIPGGIQSIQTSSISCVKMDVK